MRVAENNGTGGAMMRISRPQPVSLDKGLCRMGIRSHTAENDTLPYPCDAEIRHRMSENLERRRCLKMAKAGHERQRLFP